VNRRKNLITSLSSRSSYRRRGHRCRRHAASNETLDGCRKADAVFLGAVGGPKWDALPVGKRPERGLLDLRKGLGLYVNVRPVKLLEPLRGISPLKADRLGDLDLEIVRELSAECILASTGTPRKKGVERAWDTESYSTPEIERIASFAYARAEETGRGGYAPWTKRTY